MRKIIVMSMMGLVMSTLCGCGNKSVTVTGADGREYDSYQSACRNQVFVAAYDWIEKNNGSEEDKDYVFNAEMLYLTSLGTEEASNRIVYLLAEYQIPGTPVQSGVDYYNDACVEAKKYIEGLLRFNKRCDNVIDMAIAQDNKILSEKIIKLYKQSVTGYFSGSSSHVSVDGFSWESRDAAKAKVEAAFGSEENKE